MTNIDIDELNRNTIYAHITPENTPVLDDEEFARQISQRPTLPKYSEELGKGLILISNSIPKSGSTFLFEMQNNLFQRAFDSEDATRLLKKSQLGAIGGFLNISNSDFENRIANSECDFGPVVIKAHCMLGKGLIQQIVSNDNIFVSFCVRDPIDVFFSARRNFLARGEFPEFENVETAIKVINGYFWDIYSSVSALNEELKLSGQNDRLVPFIKYEDIVADPKQAVMSSLSERLKAILESAGAEIKHLINDDLVEAANQGASARMQLGKAKSTYVGDDRDIFNKLTTELADVRSAFGY